MYASATVGATLRAQAMEHCFSTISRVSSSSTYPFASSALRSVSQVCRTSATHCGTASSTVSLYVAVRHYTNVLYRIPPTQTIPTHSPKGEEVDAELFVRQLRGLINVIAHTQLVEQVYEMKECPYYDCLFTNELFFQHYDMLLPMPKFGREHRSAESSETVRYMRGWGATADVIHLLQDVKGGRASGADFISTSHGILMGYGTPRTNKLAMLALTGSTENGETSSETVRQLTVEPIELLPESPPLSDILAFTGQRTFIYSDTEHGHRAVTQAMQRIPKVPWQAIKVEPGCSFFSHMGSATYVYDVPCDQDFPVSMERLGESGLNPFPVEWSEPRKLGVTMRSVCATARFARGSMNGGGQWDSHGHKAAEFTYNSRDVSKNARLFAGGHRKFGDQLSPLAAQMAAGEIQPPIYQPVPRYAAPMHNRGSAVPVTKSS